MVLVLKRSFGQIPVELEDEARVDGANRLPAALIDRVASVTPDPCSGSDFVFIGAWNNYLWPFNVTTDAG
jgi:multiple sugar transport system permease protein